MKWTNFEESNKEYPEKIVEKSIEGFYQATKGLAEVVISEVDDFGRLSAKVPGDFKFKVVLISPYVKGYSLKLLTFGYDVELNPIYFVAEEAIHQEIYKEPLKYGYHMVCKDGEGFSKTLEKIFSSKRFIETVSGLMKIARKNAQSRDENL